MKSVSIFLVLTLSKVSLGMEFTALEIDNHPCKPENLKLTNRYICNSTGSVICQSGWKEPSDPEKRDELNPCPRPICGTDTETCVNGICTAPDHCACEIGWEGTLCDICVPLPGCLHGNCTDALECNCGTGWTGGYCDVPSCPDCENGHCDAPNQCICYNGWTGANCDDCVVLPGCVEGTCTKSDNVTKEPNTCHCKAGYGGHLCDVPTCTPECHEDNGHCVEGKSDKFPHVHFCLCNTGWKGDTCSDCCPYWNCPEKDLSVACKLPNECRCSDATKKNDTTGLCGQAMLIRTP